MEVSEGDNGGVDKVERDDSVDNDDEEQVEAEEEDEQEEEEEAEDGIRLVGVRPL